MYYRADWLKKNNLSVPTTPEELTKVLKVFKEKENATSGLGLSKSMVGSYLTLDRYLQVFGANPFSSNTLPFMPLPDGFTFPNWIILGS